MDQSIRQAAGLRLGWVEALEGRTLLSVGTLDRSFDGDGFAAALPWVEFTAIAAQADGKIVAVGTELDVDRTVTPDKNFIVARFTDDGKLDTTFGYGDGITNVDFRDDDFPVAVAITPQGKIVIAGSTNSTFDVGRDWAVARLNANGSPDNSFSGDGKVTFHVGTANDTLTAMTLQADGKILLTGTSFVETPDADTARLVLGRLTANGEIDKAFGGLGTGYNTISSSTYNLVPSSMVIMNDGKTAVLSTAKTNSREFDEGLIHIATFNTNGTRADGPLRGKLIDPALFYSDDFTFGFVLQFSTNDLIVLPSGNLAINSSLDYYHNWSADVIKTDLLVTLDPYGRAINSAYTTIGRNFTAETTSMVYSGGDLWTAGKTDNGGMIIHRYDAATLVGSQWTYIGDVYYYNTEIHDITVDRTGRLLIAGGSYNLGFDFESVLFRLNGLPVSAGPDADDQFSESNYISTSALVSGAISNSRDVSVYRFVAARRDRISFDVDTNGSPLDGYLRLFNYRGEEIASNDNGAAPGEILHRSPYLEYYFVQDDNFFNGLDTKDESVFFVAISGKGNQNFDPMTGLGDGIGSTGAFTLQMRVI